MSNYAFADTLVSTQWLADHLNDPQVRVIEIDGNRTAYDSGHIPNAVLWNAPKDLLLPDWRVNVDKDAAADLFARSGIHHDTTVVFYSASLSANALGFWYMKLFGHRDARLLDGSRKKWVAENRPLTTAAPTVAPARYTPAEPNAELRALRAQVEAVIGKPDYAIVDTRRLAEYSGQWFYVKPPENNERAGHIPGAKHVYFEMALNNDGTFKSADELRRLYEGNGVTPDKEVITYCAAGWRAGHTWLVLKYLLGYPNVRNYDASWYEWGRASDTPIEK